MFRLPSATAINVATREGGVDRNSVRELSYGGIWRSPPARVAWIETILEAASTVRNYVATREGGVDRNFRLSTDLLSYVGRHPRGWRG